MKPFKVLDGKLYDAAGDLWATLPDFPLPTEPDYLPRLGRWYRRCDLILDAMNALPDWSLDPALSEESNEKIGTSGHGA